MKTNNKKIFRELRFSITMTLVSMAILTLGLCSDSVLLTPLGMIGVLVFGDELIALCLPIRRYLRLKRALQGLNAKALTDWFVRDASYQEREDFLAYLPDDCFFEIFKECNNGVYCYQRMVGTVKYMQALMRICQAGESRL